MKLILFIAYCRFPAIITPPDVVSQIMIALPMLLLYQLSIWLCRVFRKRKIAGNEDEEEDEEEEKAKAKDEPKQS